MMDRSPERTREEVGKAQFHLTGFTQAEGIRIYAFEGRIDAKRMDYTVEVDLALIPGYGIRIQELPLLCRELLQLRTQPDELSSVVFTEQQMRSHAEKVAIARQGVANKRRQPGHLVAAQAETDWLPAR